MELNNAEYTKVVDALQSRFPKSINDVGVPYEMLTLSVENADIKSIIKYLSEEEMGFTYLTDVCGMHYESTDELGVVYHIQNLYTNTRVRLKRAFLKVNLRQILFAIFSNRRTGKKEKLSISTESSLKDILI